MGLITTSRVYSFSVQLLIERATGARRCKRRGRHRTVCEIIIDGSRCERSPSAVHLDGVGVYWKFPHVNQM